MTYNPSKMCLDCLKSRVDLASEISKHQTLQFCRHCGKYNKPPWVRADLESPELLQVCLSRIRGLSRVKFADASFIWTEPNSRRVKVRVTVRGEVEKALLEQNCVVEFEIVDTQCEECQKSFTPHTWNSKVQVRQRTHHKRTIYHLEQLILKNGAQKECLGIKPKDNGIDFHFGSKGSANKFVEFVKGNVPCQVKFSKQLTSHDAKSNQYNYKYTHLVEIVPICRDDLVVVPQSKHQSKLALCYKVGSTVYLLDAASLQPLEIKPEKYFRNPIYPLAVRDQLTEFIVMDLEAEKDHHIAEVARANDENFGEEVFQVRTHLGRILNPGDSVLGYDIARMTDLDTKEVDIVLVKKLPPPKKPKKLRRLADVSEDKDYTKFEQEYSEDD